eukprot:TRINITY_DN3748_c0_g2_i1.p1 TRINITY_DN3748_c0_g2~~TRINITY_DN3748_c0_g2_i1.p1  ORF type:complete len:214 (-),score=50.72 TRINITY_DN3748_c0_g2_i1:126-767(-)
MHTIQFSPSYNSNHNHLPNKKTFSCLLSQFEPSNTSPKNNNSSPNHINSNKSSSNSNTSNPNLNNTYKINNTTSNSIINNTKLNNTSNKINSITSNDGNNNTNNDNTNNSKMDKVQVIKILAGEEKTIRPLSLHIPWLLLYSFCDDDPYEPRESLEHSIKVTLRRKHRLKMWASYTCWPGDTSLTPFTFTTPPIFLTLITNYHDPAANSTPLP